jgi:HD-GYP domain-containing protein (c-di-GMP phosphodiesterase class II)
MHMPDALVRDYGVAGLFHDIGKMAIPSAILNKPGQLTDTEFLTIKSHPRAGYDILKDVDGISEIILDVCLHHHERIDGRGYPDNQAGDSLSQAARMAAICDVYDAITSNRPYKKGWSPTESLRKMAIWAREGHFDQTLFEAFVKCVGIYPVGTLVRLKSNRLAVVIDNSVSLIRPIVRVFFSITSMTYIPTTTINLNQKGITEIILSCEEEKKWDLRNIDNYWSNV